MAVDTHGNPTPVAPGETIEANHHTAVVARVVGTYPSVADRDIGRPNPNIGEAVHVESIPGLQVWDGLAWRNIRDDRTFAHTHEAGDLLSLPTHSHTEGDLPPLDYLPLSGGTLTGRLTIDHTTATMPMIDLGGSVNEVGANGLRMGGHRITYVGAATSGHHALNREVGDGRYVRPDVAVDGKILAADGSQTTPGISFGDDPDSGIYRIGTNRIGIATNGLIAWEVNSGGNLEATSGGHRGVIRAGNGSSALPAFSFDSDQDLGMYRSGTNNLSFTTAGVQRFLITGTRIEAKEHLVVGVSGHSLGWKFSPGIGTGDFQAYLDDDGSGDWTWRVGTTSSSKSTKRKRAPRVDPADLATRFLSVPLRRWKYTAKHHDAVGTPKGSPNRGREIVGHMAEELGEAVPELVAQVDGVAKIKDGRPMTAALIATIQHLGQQVADLTERLDALER